MLGALNSRGVSVENLEVQKPLAFISYSSADKNIADNLCSKLEQNGVRAVLDGSTASKRRLLGSRDVQHLGRIPTGRVRHIGIDQAGGDAVHADAMRPHVLGAPRDHAQQRALRRRVGKRARNFQRRH